MAKIKIPPVLRPSVGGEKEVQSPAATTSARSCARSPPSTPPRSSSCSAPTVPLNRYVNVYLNDEDVRVLNGLDTSVGESDTLVILPAMAGGCV